MTRTRAQAGSTPAMPRAAVPFLVSLAAVGVSDVDELAEVAGRAPTLCLTPLSLGTSLFGRHTVP